MTINTSKKIEIITTEEEYDIIADFYRLITDIKSTIVDKDKIENNEIKINNCSYDIEKIINLQDVVAELFWYA